MALQRHPPDRKNHLAFFRATTMFLRGTGSSYATRRTRFTLLSSIKGRDSGLRSKDESNLARESRRSESPASKKKGRALYQRLRINLAQISPLPISSRPYLAYSSGLSAPVCLANVEPSRRSNLLANRSKISLSLRVTG